MLAVRANIDLLAPFHVTIAEMCVHHHVATVYASLEVVYVTLGNIFSQ